LSGIKNKSGGKRPGAGRKITAPRCHCGKHSMTKAVAQRLRCRNAPPPVTASAA